VNYKNPRKRAVIEEWPCGKYTTTATFTIEAGKKGERAVRTTLHPFTMRPRAPIKLTFAKKARIVDGEDGKTYILELSQSGHIVVMQGTMDYQVELVFPTMARFPELLALFGEEVADVA
jgi:hypothetical protein